MEELEQLQRAIQALEAQRGVLGDEVVSTALAPLQQKLAVLQRQKNDERRKLVTVLFSDLVGFTSMSERLDPEDVRAILDPYFNRWSEVIQRYGGWVEKYIGDAVVAIYGHPVARENDTENAIRTALEMREALTELNEAYARDYGLRLNMRVGITTGQVILSASRDRQQGMTVLGDAVQLAGRLQSYAPVNGVLISHDTYRHVRGAFDVRPLDPVEIPERWGPIRVYLVKRVKPRSFRSVTRGVEGVETRMIGRVGELKRLQDAFWEALEQGQQQTATLIGEAGIGKSRLLYEFANWLDLLPQEAYYFQGRAFPATQVQPYSLLRSMFAFRFQIYESDPPTDVTEKLEKGLAMVLGGREDYQLKAHVIGYILGFEPGESPHIISLRERLGKDWAQVLQERALAYLAEYFGTLAQTRPVVLLLEDIHWADDSSLNWITQVGKQLANRPLLIVCAARPSLLERRPHWGEGLSFHTRLNLMPLTKRESRSLVIEILQKVESVPDSLRELVVANAEGNPFYIEELIRMLIEDEVIIKGEDRWQIEPARLVAARVPETLTGVLQARFDGLQPAERTTLQRASVIGRIFWDRAVEFLGRQASAQEEPELAGEVFEKLRTREMIYQREDSAFEDTREYLFKHALLRDVIYESLLKQHRRAYHAHAARWLEGVTQENQRYGEYAALVAWHYENAGDRELASAWYARAGEQAARRYANAEAVYSYSRALDLASPDDITRRYELLFSRQLMYERLSDRQKLNEDLDVMEQLADRLDDNTRRAYVLLRRSYLGFMTSDYTRGAEMARKAIPLAQSAGDVQSEVEGLLWLGKSLGWQGDPEGAALLEQALERVRAAQLTALEAEILWNLSVIVSNSGDYERARRLLEDALAIFRRMGNQEGESVVLGQLGVVMLSQGKYEEAKEYSQTALHLYRMMGFRLREAIALNNLGIIAFERADFSEAQRLFAETLHVNLEIEDSFGISSGYGNLGDVAREQGDLLTAQQYYDRALAVAVEIGDRLMESILRSNFGLLAIYRGDYETAIQVCREAVDIVREIDYSLYEISALNRLGQALEGAGRLDEAGATYGQALELQRKSGLEDWSMASLAGLARVASLKGELEAARRWVEPILAHLRVKELEGAEEPAPVYLTCILILQAVGDPLAEQLLRKAHQMLEKRMARLSDASLRQNFLENLPANRKLMALWAAQGELGLQ